MSGEYYSVSADIDFQIPFLDYLNEDFEGRTFYVTLNQKDDVFSTRNRHIKILPGHHTVIRVNVVRSRATQDVNSMDVEERKCRLPHENEGLELFEAYTQGRHLL